MNSHAEDRVIEAVARLVRVEDREYIVRFTDALARGDLRLSSLNSAVQDCLGLSQQRLSPYMDTLTAASTVESLVFALRISTVTATELKSRSPHIEVVWTYPSPTLPGFRTTGGVSREIIDSSQRTLLVIGYSVNVPNNLAGLAAQTIDAMAGAAARGVQVTVALHRDEVGANRGQFLRAWRSDVAPPVIYTWSRSDDEMAKVHAKVLVSDGTESLVTSANLTYHGLQGNLEMGLHVTGGDVPRQIDDKIQELIQHGALQPWSS